MSKGIYRILAGLAALFLGIGVAWASNLFRIAFYPFENSALSEKVPPIGSVGGPSSEESGKLVIRFKGFQLHKDWAANFEIVNFSNDAVTYIGRETTDEYGLCTIAAQRDTVFEPTGANVQHFGDKMRSSCLYSTNVGLRKFVPGDSINVSIDKDEVQELVDIKTLKSAQIGFEFFVGDKKLRRVYWSEEITFPEDLGVNVSR